MKSNLKLYRVGLDFTIKDECVIQAQTRTQAIARVKQLYKHKAKVRAGNSCWEVDYEMLDTIGKKEIIKIPGETL